MQKMFAQQNGLRRLSLSLRFAGMLVLCLTLASVFPGVVRAAIAVINTNDGAWDSNWGNPLRVDGDDPGVADDLDIDTFWVNTDGATPSTYYFGLSTVAPLRTYGGVRVCVKVDCNGDGDVTDAVDKSLEINPGDTYYDTNGNSSSPWEINSAADGEFIGRFLEARTNASGSISWAGCMASNPVIKAEVRDWFCPNEGTMYDETVLRGYDLPTAVRLQDFSARAGGAGWSNWLLGSWLLVLGVLGGLALISAGIFLQRRLCER